MVHSVQVLYPSLCFGDVTQWLRCRSVAGGLFLIYA